MAATDSNIVSPNLSMGRDRSTPSQIDEKGNSVVTGKPPTNSMDIYQAQEAAARAKHPAQASPAYDADPMWGLQDGQTEVDVKHAAIRLPGALSPEVPLQPDHGWTPNPEDLTPPDPYQFERTPQSRHDAEQPNWAWNPQDEPIPREPTRVARPGGISPEVPLQPDFGWVPTN
ncbi:hypothetical protein Q6670_004047 [Salmonella enterica]|nr:hypothetical protein [Salmonella enterica]